LREPRNLWTPEPDSGRSSSEIDFDVDSGAAADPAVATVRRTAVRRTWAINRAPVAMLSDGSRMHAMLQRPVSVRRRPGRRTDVMVVSRRTRRNHDDRTIVAGVRASGPLFGLVRRLPKERGGQQQAADGSRHGSE
jgi:hypothetical protein